MSDDQYHRALADVNGDGRADIVGFGSAATFVALASSNGTFQAPVVGINTFGTSDVAGGWSSDDRFPRKLADVNGDGRADIVGFGDAGVFVSLANANGTFQAPFLGINVFGTSVAAGGWSSDDRFPRQLADVNGDGRADIVGFGDAGVFVSLANTNGTFQSPFVAINSFGASEVGGGWSSDTIFPRRLADVNGDGRADIVGFGGAGVFLSLGRSDGTFASPTLDLESFGFEPSAGGFTSNDLFPRITADVNGDHRDDIIGFGDAGVFVSFAKEFLFSA